MKTRMTWMAMALICLAAGAARSAPTSLWIESVAYDCNTAIDDTVRVDVMFNSINSPIDQVGLGVYYYSTDLTFIRAERGALTTGWSTWNTGDGAGPTPSLRQLNIDSADPTPIPAGISGHFATLVFVQTWCPTGLGVSTLELCVAQAYHDILNIDTYCGAVKFTKPASGSLVLETVYQNCGSVLGDTVEVDVIINGASQPVDAAGIDIPYPTVFNFVGYRRGDLTAAWPFFDAADHGSYVRVGGFSGTPIAGGSSGVFVTLRFLVYCCEGASGDLLCFENAVDDFAGMTTTCGTVTCVALATKKSTWGFVKSLYR